MTQILHISDLHILPKGQLFYDQVDTAQALRRLVAALPDLEDLVGPIDRLVISGDLSESGCAASYETFMEIMEDVALPWRAIPGNHDHRDRMRAACAAQTWMPRSGALNWCEDLEQLTLIGLDTLCSGQPHGTLSAETLAWLQQQLEARQGHPILLFMHHPPFATGIAGMDAIGLHDSAPLAALLRGHTGPMQICCGHVHRSCFGSFANHPAFVAPGLSHSIVPNLTPQAPVRFTKEEAGIALHRFDQQLCSLTLQPSRYADSHAF